MRHSPLISSKKEIGGGAYKSKEHYYSFKTLTRNSG